MILKSAPEQSQDDVLVRMDLDLVVSRHPDPGEHEERSEHVEHELEAFEERRAGGDERRAEHQRAEDPPEQHAVLQALRHGEVPEDQDEDEDVVCRQRVLEQIAGDVLAGEPTRPATPRSRT